MKRVLTFATATCLLISVVARAQEPAPTLAVRKDALRPGWFFVGVVPGADKNVPILVELRAGSETATAHRFRSPHPRSFDLCSLLRSAGLASQGGRLFLQVSRGPSSFRFSIPYDGKLCTASSAPPADAVASSSPSTGIPSLTLELPPPPPSPSAGAPVVAVAEASAPRAAPPSRTETAPAEPARPPKPAPTRAASAPAPAKVPEVAVAAAPAPASEPEPEAEAEAAPEGLSAAERGLTADNFDRLDVYLIKDKKLGSEDIQFVLRFKRPVNIEGIESVAFLQTRIVRGRAKDFLDPIESDIDETDDPRNALAISTTVSMGMALEPGGVNQLVTARIQVGIDPALATFEGKVGLKRGLER